MLCARVYIPCPPVWMRDMPTRPDNLSSLESFQMEIGRRILKLPSFFSNLTVHICLGWPSMTSRQATSTRISLYKFLYIFTAAAITDPWNVSIIQQCRMLENITETNTSFMPRNSCSCSLNYKSRKEKPL